MAEQQLEELSIITIRMLSADGVEQAKSGHPGLPMGAAAFAYTLWTQQLRYSPANPQWFNRDRFVLSAGHGSMLLYSLLHLTGYDLPLDALKHFRQWGSLTPGHPEHGLTAGVETTTGPLGQGFANGVGMAIAERFMADRFNQAGHEIIDYYTYALVSDGDLMEGISAEAASYAGTLKLGKLIYMYDSNQISIEGSTDITFQDNTAARFESYGWHTLTVEDGNDTASVAAALQEAKADDRPSLIILKTHIGFGSPNKHDTAGAHGSPLGADELQKTKQAAGWPLEPNFYIPDEVLEHMRGQVDIGKQLEQDWLDRLATYEQAYPQLAAELHQLMCGEYSDAWQQTSLPSFSPDENGLASREASGLTMNVIADRLPLFLGGSADLGPSNNTHLENFGNISGNGWDTAAKNLHFGIREHAMAGILNGIALTRGIRCYGATFLIFSDYMRGSMRLAALMKLPVVYVLTHDSIGQGEDGATHQPIEQLAGLRAVPGLTVIRPADANETVEAWNQAMKNTDGPTVLVLSRQKLPTLDRTELAPATELTKGGYILKDAGDTPDLIMIATGSEVSLAFNAAANMHQEGLKVRVVSMPCTELFDAQNHEYKTNVLPDGVPTLVVEAASSYGWERYIGQHGASVTIDHFGASAPGNVVRVAHQLLDSFKQ
jgi:transketolase